MTVASEEKKILSFLYQNPYFWKWGSSLAILLIVVFHTFQGIFISGFVGIPGDMGDARLNNFVLEHLYQWFQGVYSLNSPGQFYPVENTLSYSDHHFGDGPLYIIFRSLGFSIFSAFQLWLIFTHVLNILSLLFLLHILRISWLLRGFVCFFSLSSFGLIQQLGHAQLLPMYPFILAMGFLIRFLDQRKVGDLYGFMFLFTWQHYCTIYVGYFQVLIFLPFVFFRLWLLGPKNQLRDILAIMMSYRWRLLAASVSCILALYLLYLPYIEFSREQGTRSLTEIRSLSPVLGHWFSASPFSLFYGGQQFLKPNANAGESYLFSGWMIWLVGIGVLLFYFQSKHRAEFQWMIVFLFTWFFIGLLFTTWNYDGRESSVYLIMLRYLEPLRAVRAVGRIALLVFILQGVMAGLAIQQMLTLKEAKWKWTGLIIAFVLSFEMLSFPHPVFSKVEAQERTDSLLKMISRDDPRQIVAFVPGLTLDPWHFVHLDAWHAALQTKRKCINGYSGNEPQTHSRFLRYPTPQTVYEILEQRGISESEVIFIENWHPSNEKQRGNKLTDIEIQMLGQSGSVQAKASSRFQIPVILVNQSPSRLPLSRLNLHPSYRMYDELGIEITDPATLRSPVDQLNHLEKKKIELQILAPSRPGRYSIHVSMVHEGVAWWEDLNKGGPIISLIVVP